MMLNWRHAMAQYITQVHSIILNDKRRQGVGRNMPFSQSPSLQDQNSLNLTPQLYFLHALCAL